MPPAAKLPYPPPTYHFTLKAGEGFIAQIALSSTCSLYELAETCIKAIGFDFDHAFGFYDNLKNAYDSSEKYTLFADIGEAEDSEPGVGHTFIGNVFEPGQTMALLFDYGDDWMFPVYCKSIVAGKSRRKSRRVLSHTGTPPIQYEYPDDEDEFEEN